MNGPITEPGASLIFQSFHVFHPTEVEIEVSKRFLFYTEVIGFLFFLLEQYFAKRSWLRKHQLIWLKLRP